jgi:DNA mismatch endonuclease (patch repair protein)
METPERRSRTMRAVKGANTSPELKVRSLLYKAGYRYRLHARDLPGKPDLVFPRRKAVIFVHGCFWHGHPCKRGARIPKTNRAYWLNKIARNRSRDRRVRSLLKKEGWRTLIIWECTIKNEATLLRRLKAFLEL